MNASPSGLRERKRQETRERLTAAGMALFLTQGFEATTLDQIAAAADISRRSFFHHFASKEDLVFAWQDSFCGALIQALSHRPDDEPPIDAAIGALVATLGSFDRDQAEAIARFVEETPALRDREQVKYALMEQALAEALARRPGAPADPLETRLVAMVVIGAMRVAGESWRATGEEVQPGVFAREVFATLRRAVEGRG
jgi:AcrR family transcriptional regulator